MFVLNLVFLALLATSRAQQGIPQYIQGRWVITDESLQYEDVNGLVVDDGLWPASPPEVVELVTENQNLPSAPEPFVIKEQDSTGEELAVWKIVLVAAVLLVSVAGSLSMAYYMCVWRGGRIHYRPQKVSA